MPLEDHYGRRVTGLRIALTPRCNLKCIYCHHEGEFNPGGEITGRMAVATAKAGRSLGIRSVKITGGEPLLRPDLEDIIRQLPDDMDVSLTTNGTFLAQRAASLALAGLDRVNVSLDSLRPEVYRAITGANNDDLDRVLDGIKAAMLAGLQPVKLNMVVLKENQGEVWDLIDFSRQCGAVLQLIELMNIRCPGRGGDLDAIESQLHSRADRIVTRDMHRRRKYFVGGAEVEVVRPMDNTEFCANCNRLRVTSDGKLKPCLLRSDNLLEISSTDEADISMLIREAVRRREPFFTGSHERKSKEASI